MIADTLLARRPDVVAPPPEPFGTWRVMRWVLPTLIAVNAGALLLMARHVSAHDGADLEPIGGIELELLTLGGSVSVITLICSLVLLGIHVLLRLDDRR